MLQHLGGRFFVTGGRELRSAAARSLMGVGWRERASELRLPALGILAPLHAPLPVAPKQTNKPEKAKLLYFPFPPQFSCSGLLCPLLSGHHLLLPLSCRKQCPGPNWAESSGKAARAESSEMHSPLDPRPSVTSAPQRFSAPAARAPREAPPTRATVTNFPRGGSCTQGFCPPPPSHHLHPQPRVGEPTNR